MVKSQLRASEIKGRWEIPAFNAAFTPVLLNVELENPVAAVVTDDEFGIDPVVHCSPKRLDRVHGTPIAGEADHGAAWVRELEPDGSRDAHPERPSAGLEVRPWVLRWQVPSEVRRRGQRFVEYHRVVRQSCGELCHEASGLQWDLIPAAPIRLSFSRIYALACSRQFGRPQTCRLSLLRLQRRLQVVGDGSERQLGIGNDPDVHWKVLANLVGVEVNVDDARTGGECAREDGKNLWKDIGSRDQDHVGAGCNGLAVRTEHVAELSLAVRVSGRDVGL